MQIKILECVCLCVCLTVFMGGGGSRVHVPDFDDTTEDGRVVVA